MSPENPEQRRRPRVDRDEALRLILESTVPKTGAAFLRALVRNVCRALRTHGCWVTEWIPDRRRLRSLAFWLGDDWVERYEYAVDGTPCEPVIDRCGLAHFPRNVIELFPRDPDLPALQAMSYIGVPLREADGSILGHLAALDTEPMHEEPGLFEVFELFAERAAAEVRRLRAEQLLRDSEERLSRLFDSTMDAILVLDGELRVVRANPAAARILATPLDGLAGSPAHRFLENDASEELRARVGELDRLPPERRKFWFPHGLAARRAGGASFAAEATLSCFETGQRTFHTLILRDVNDRMEAERRLQLLADEAEYLRDAVREAPGGGEILGRSRSMQRLFHEIERVAATDATVLILGETGTGKELVARAIHRAGRRADGPLVRVNCAAIPGALMESEFFGHERGAFTGAAGRREGRFALADRGTIFLDEVGELPLDLQAKLLRVLQEGEFEPLGGTRTRKVDVRVVAATHRDLARAVREGEFREDLFYRLDVFPVHVPPLRERAEDIPLLAEAFARRYARRMGRRVEPLGAGEIAWLRTYPWPGNVRELQNVIERALILSSGPALSLAHAMPRGERTSETDRAAAAAEASGDRILSAAELQELERANMRRALEASDWKVSGRDGAAARLGIPPSTLASRMKTLGLRRPRSRR